MEKFKIGTHNGTFHSDEVFASAIILGIFQEAEIVRTRKVELLEPCDVVFDVGGGKYDHHTTGKQYRENKVPYASAGLIWRDFGKKYLVKNVIDLNEDEINNVLKSVDESLFVTIDALDNGENIISSEFKIKTISSVISDFNSNWNESTISDKKFNEAVSLAKIVLKNQVNRVVSQIKAKTIIVDAFKNREQAELLILTTFCPWQEHLLSMDKNHEVLFAIYKDMNNGYRIQVVPKKLGEFTAIKDLPEEWAGKSDEEIVKATGVADAIFCHPGRFIAGAASYSGIMKMAQLAIEAKA